MISRMSEQDHKDVAAAISENIRNGFQKRIGEGHAPSPKPSRIEPGQWVKSLPPWLRPYLTNTRGDYMPIEYLQQRVSEYEGNIRNQQWHKARIIAAVVCTTQAGGGNTAMAIEGWGLSTSRAWYWVSLARVFPPELENAQMESERYHLIYQLAKHDLGLKNRPRNQEQWDEISKTACDMFEEFETWDTKALRNYLKDLKGKSETEATKEEDEDHPQYGQLQFKSYIDVKGVLRQLVQGMQGDKINLADLLANHNMTDQAVEIIIKPIVDHEQGKLV